MKTVRTFSACLAVAALSSAAHAEPPAPKEKPPARAPSAGESVGYQIELGASTTYVVRGASQGATKSTPSTEDLMVLRFRDLGPGQLSVGNAFAMPFAGLAGQPQFAMNIIPFTAYQLMLGPVQTTVGFAVKFFPNAEVVDGQYEGLTRVALPNRYLTPFVEVFPELVRRRGVYAAAGVDREILAGAFSFRPRVLVGAQGFSASSESFHANEATAMLVARAKLGAGFYAQLTPAYSVLIGPERYVSDSSWSGRSVAYAAFGIGVER